MKHLQQIPETSPIVAKATSSSLNLYFSDSEKDEVKLLAKAKGFKSVTDYFKHVVRREKRALARKQREALGVAAK